VDTGVDMSLNNTDILGYDVYFFRHTEKYLEKVHLIHGYLKKQYEKKRHKAYAIVDSFLQYGGFGHNYKANQMISLSHAGLPVPKTIFACLSSLKQNFLHEFTFPVILKGS